MIWLQQTVDVVRTTGADVIPDVDAPIPAAASSGSSSFCISSTTTAPVAAATPVETTAHGLLFSCFSSAATEASAADCRPDISGGRG